MDQAFVPEKASKLVVRVKIDSSTGVEAETEEAETEFNPMAIGLLSAFLLLVVVGGGYYFYTASSTTPVISSALTLQLTPLDVSVSPPIVVSEGSNELESLDAIISAQENVALIPPIVLDDQKSDEVLTTETEAVSVEAAVLDEQELSSSVAPLLIEKSVIKESFDQGVSEKTPVKNNYSMLRDVDLVLSKHISRAHLAYGIKSREPINIVEHVVLMKPGGIEKINFFTELKNLKGQAIRHIWFHNDKQVSEIQFNIRGNRWRVYSSKLLNQSAIGNWEVHVVNEMNDLIFLEKFEYK